MCADLAWDEQEAATMDTNQDGTITPQELGLFLKTKSKPSPQEVPAVQHLLEHKKMRQLGKSKMRQQDTSIRTTAVVSEEVAAERLTADSGGALCGVAGLCSGHGECNTATGKCDCQPDYMGESCETKLCVGFIEVGSDCFGHGMCQMGKCDCADGWGMFSNRTGPQSCQDRVCVADCGVHGRCVDGICACFQGWTGQMCRDPQCAGGCSGHGTCTFITLNSPGECSCDYGWAGAACHRPAVYATQPACPEDCTGNGLCMNGICNCNVGVTGPSCNMVMSSASTSKTCPLDCHGNGLCFNGECSCSDAYGGHDCSIPIPCLAPCRDACLGNAEGMEASQKCLFCVGQCTTLRSHPVLGVHSPFEDLQSTLLQRQLGGPSVGLRGHGRT